MLTDDKLKEVQHLVAGFSSNQLIWLSGYLSGLAGSGQETAATLPAVAGNRKITIAYGTESGNSKKLATDFAVRAKAQGLQTKLVNLAQYRLTDLMKEEYFFTVISTQGEGEPPEAAKKFYDFLASSPPRLDQMKYGVLALGDTSYPLFCKAGEDIDLWLGRSGATQVVALQRCDTDYAEEATAWITTVLSQLESSAGGAVKQIPALTKKATGKIIYEGTVLSNINLNDRGSAKQTHHIEIAAENVTYAPGDSLGIVPENPSRVVDSIIAITGISAVKMVSRGDETLTVSDWLKKKLNIVYLSERNVRRYAGLTGHDIPATRIGLLDLLKIYPVQHTAQFEEVLDLLEPITPRLYSISSSPALHENEIHLTVALEKFSTSQELHYGLCSDHLINQATGSVLKFYIHKNERFKLPAESADIIMIGPGTGIAPFRSFLAEREAQNASGKNWLFFGDQHFTSDFLYQTEIQDWHQTGLLTKVNLAFSRDQAEKIYVQHRMLEQAAELYAWISRGAVVYICGSRSPMGDDVEQALMQIAAEQGGQLVPSAWLENLAESGHYLKDVY